jgi:hypothetical protein
MPPDLCPKIHLVKRWELLVEAIDVWMAGGPPHTGAITHGYRKRMDGKPVTVDRERMCGPLGWAEASGQRCRIVGREQGTRKDQCSQLLAFLDATGQGYHGTPSQISN